MADPAPNVAFLSLVVNKETRNLGLPYLLPLQGPEQHGRCEAVLVTSPREAAGRNAPSEHRIAHAMKTSKDLALFEQVLAATALDANAKLSALRTFETYWRAWFIRQYAIGCKRSSNPIAVAVAAEALGFRDIKLSRDAGIVARTPLGSHINVSPIRRRPASPAPAG